MNAFRCDRLWYNVRNKEREKKDETEMERKWNSRIYRHEHGKLKKRLFRIMSDA